MGWLLATCLLLPCATAAATQRDMENDALLLQESQALALFMDALAKSDFIRLMTSSPEIVELTQAITAQSYDAPTSAVVMEIDGMRWLEPLLAQEDGPGIAALPSDIQAFVAHRVVSSLPSMLVAQQGAVTLAAVSQLAVMRSYALPQGMQTDTVVCLQYGEGEYSVMVTFTQTGDGTMTANALYVPIAAGSLQDWLTAAAQDAQVELAALGVTYTVYDEEAIQALPDAQAQ